MKIFLEFELIIILITIIILGYAAYADWKTREILDLPWIFLILISFPVNFLRIIIYWDSIEYLFLVSMISIFLGILIIAFMGFLGYWGGADLLAILSLSLMFPFPIFVPDLYSTALNSIFIYFPFSLTIILNSALLQIPIPFLIFIKNTINFKKSPESFFEPKSSSKIEKFFSSFIGSPEKISNIVSMNPWFYNFMEEVSTPFSIRWNQFSLPKPFLRLSSEQLLRYKNFWSIRRNDKPKIYFNNMKIQNLLSMDSLKEQRNFSHKIKLNSPEKDLFDQRTILNQFKKGKVSNYLWIQYSVPFVVFVFLGLILSIAGGNILFLIISLL